MAYMYYQQQNQNMFYLLCRFNRKTTPWLVATFHAPWYSSCKLFSAQAFITLLSWHCPVLTCQDHYLQALILDVYKCIHLTLQPSTLMRTCYHVHCIVPSAAATAHATKSELRVLPCTVMMSVRGCCGCTCAPPCKAAFAVCLRWRHILSLSLSCGCCCACAAVAADTVHYKQNGIDIVFTCYIQAWVLWLQTPRTTRRMNA